MKMFRGGKSKFFLWGIMGMLVLGLVGFGFTDVLRGGVQSRVAVVGDERVDNDLYYRAVQIAMRDAGQRLGTSLTVDQAIALGIPQGTLARLVNGAALDNEAGKLGISHSDDAVRDAVTSNEAFQGLSGAFDKEAYVFALERNGLKPEEYEAELRTSLTRQLLSGVVGNGVSGNDAVNDAILSFLREARSADIIRITEANLNSAIAEPLESDLSQYLADNEAAFTQPETKLVTYIILNPEMLIEGIEVPEADIAQEYEARTAEFNKPEQRALDRIVFGSPTEAQAAKDRIDTALSTFLDEASARGMSAAEASLGMTVASSLEPAEREIIFGGSALGVYGPVESEFGPAIYRVNAIIPAISTSLEEASETLRGELALRLAQDQAYNILTEAEDLLAAGASLEEIAAETSAELRNDEYFDGVENDISADALFAAEAGAADLDEERDPVELSNGGFAVLRVDEIRDPFVKPLDDVREELAAAWRAEQVRTGVAAMAEALRENVETTGRFSFVAFNNNLEPIAAGPVLRGNPMPNLSISVTETLFEMEAGEIRVLQDGDDALLVRLTRIEAYDPESVEAQILAEQINISMQAGIGNDLFYYYTGAIRDMAKPRINDAAIDSLLGQLR